MTGQQEFRILDRYVLLDRISEGGTSNIYRAMQASTQGIGRLMAIKCFKPDFLTKAGLTEVGLKQQIQTMIAMNHPNLVQVYDIGEERPGIPYLAMEYVHGKSLRHLVISLAKARKVLKPEFIAHVGFEVAKALTYIHALGGNSEGTAPKKMLHRNIGPQNVLISYDGEVKLIELAVMTNLKDGTNAAQLVRGRSGYTSPEELEGQVLDPRSDIFSLGVVLWEALTGSSLFTSESRIATLDKIKNCDKYVRPPSQLNKTIPKELEKVVLKALEKDPAKRYQNAHEMELALERVLILAFQDFSSTTFRDYLHILFNVEVAAEAEKIKQFLVQAEKVAKTILPSGKNAFLRKFQGNGDAESEETAILMGKVAEGAVGSRNLEVDQDTFKSVEIEAKSIPKGMGSHRGGYVKHIHTDGSSAFGSVTGSTGDPFEGSPNGSQKSYNSGPQSQSSRVTQNKSSKKSESEAEPKKYGFILAVAMALAAVFIVLPKFGIQLWSIPSLVEHFSSGGHANRATASDPVHPRK